MSSPTLEVHTGKGLLPRPIAQVLSRIERRLRAAALLRGIGTTAIVLAAVTILGMTIDFLWVLPHAVRWTIWAAAISLVAITFVVTVVIRAYRRSGAFDLAALAEREYPAMEERLTAAVGLLGNGAFSHGSPGLIAAVADRAAEQASLVEPGRLIPWRERLCAPDDRDRGARTRRGSTARLARGLPEAGAALSLALVRCGEARALCSCRVAGR